MKNNNMLEMKELGIDNLCEINGGGFLKDAVDWYYLSVGSFLHGLYDGLAGNDSDV